MNPMRIIVLVVAIGAAGMAALLLGGFFGKKQATAAPGPAVAMTEVLVAAKDMDVGHAVTAEDLKWQKWPADAVAPVFVSKSTSPAGLEDMVGSVARTNVLADEPVTSNKLVKAETASFMAATLTPGMRAVSVEISEETGAGGFILPNDRVDIVVTTEAQGSDGGRSQVISRTLLQNIRVLAVGQTFRDTAAGAAAEESKTVEAKTATLEVSPAEVEIVQLGAREGRLSLSLRGLTGADTPVALVRTPSTEGKARARTSITIIRNGSASQVQAAN